LKTFSKGVLRFSLPEELPSINRRDCCIHKRNIMSVFFHAAMVTVLGWGPPARRKLLVVTELAQKKNDTTGDAWADRH